MITPKRVVSIIDEEVVLSSYAEHTKVVCVNKIGMAGVVTQIQPATSIYVTWADGLSSPCYNNITDMMNNMPEVLFYQL